MLDGFAFVKAQKDHGAEPEGARVLLVGAGGAGRAIAIALLEAGVGELIIHDADQSRVATLIDLLSGLGRGRVVPARRIPPAAIWCATRLPWAWRRMIRSPSMLHCSYHRCSSAM